MTFSQSLELKSYKSIGLQVRLNPVGKESTCFKMKDESVTYK